MLNNKINDAINAQINAELWSAYLYLSMAMQLEDAGHAGFANWFRIQFKEEQADAWCSKLSMPCPPSGNARFVCLRTLLPTNGK